MDTNKKAPAKPEEKRRGGKPERYTVEQIAEALRGSAGIISLAAARLRCGRKAVYGYIERHPELREVLSETVEETLDLAEGKMIEGIQQGDRTFTIFFLKTKGKHRGYVERAEHTGVSGGPIETIDLSSMTDDELEQYRALLSKLRNAA